MWISQNELPFGWINVKGQLISKCLFGVLNFFQKTNEIKSTWDIIVVKSNSFVCFLEEFTALQFAFEINWPLIARVQYMILPEELITKLKF